MKLYTLRNCTQGKIFVLYKGYLESNLQWAVNKTNSEEKILLYAKNIYIFKILLNIYTAAIEVFVV
jgi:hypothetical protein